MAGWMVEKQHRRGGHAVAYGDANQRVHGRLESFWKSKGGVPMGGSAHSDRRGDTRAFTAGDAVGEVPAWA